jgi:glucose-6-phosphate 1-dehydrogenase
MNRPVRVLLVAGAAAGVGGGPAATPQATGSRRSTALGVRVKVAGEQLVGQDVELVGNDQPEEDRPAYQRLLGDALEGDDQPLASEDTVEAEWRVVEPVLGDATPVHEDEPGSWGPEEADQPLGDGGWSNPAGRERRPR